MKVLVATRQTQGKRRNDYSWTNERELVTFGFECDRDCGPDGKCGCKRALCGVDSLKATTTMQVAERPKMTPADYVQAIARSLVSGGWYDTEAEATEHAREDALELARIASMFPVGEVLEKRGNAFISRGVAEHAL